MREDKQETTVLNSWVTLVETALEEDSNPYFHIIVPDYVFILAVTLDGWVPLVKQYRIPSANITLELPAGLVENGALPKDAALIELSEEVGVTNFREVIEMPPMTLDSGRIKNKTHGFIVLQAEMPSLGLKLGELETIWIKSEEVVELAMQGKIDHMGQIALILWASAKGLL